MEFPPTLSKKLRACMNCSILQTQALYKKDGCPNCTCLNLKNRTDIIQDTTSDEYKGLIGLVNPQRSWVAKWQRLNQNVPGLYAINVGGIMPEEFINKIEESGKVYHPRDKSFGI
ncbi:transcription elongation factor spt4 [Binucleata daphniae]